MYLWIVVVTFLAALAGYVLPLRNDMAKVVDMPAAEALLMQMVVKHRAGLSYMKRQEWPYWCPESGCGDHKAVNFVVGEIANSNLHNYAASLLTTNLTNSNYKNVIKCYSVQDDVYSDNGNVCNRDQISYKNGLITYGKLSEKWLKKPGLPSEELLNVMAEKFKFNKNIGYLVKRGTSTDPLYYIRNYRGNEFLIPSVYYDTDLSTECDNATCLVYLTLR